MIIGVDGNEANVQTRVGISEYSYQILKEFAKSSSKGRSASGGQISPPKEDQTLSENLKFQIYLKQKPSLALPPESTDWRYYVFGPRQLWTQFALPAKLFLERDKPNVFFSPSHYAPRFSPIPTAISIMDLSYQFFPELFRKKDLYQLKRWTEYSVKRASLIFTISKASKKDILSIYGVPDTKVVVTYPGIKSFATLTPSLYPIHMLKSKFGIDGRYFLFVGTLQPRKNIVRLIEAFAQVLAESKDASLQLVIVGKKGWLFEEILEAPKRAGVESNVTFLEFVSDDELPSLYVNAVAYVLPSLYEGFGLPVLEAMKHSCPVITSKASSLPEAGGDAALYVNPEKTSEIAAAMTRLLKNPALRKELIEKGKKQVAKFSWEKTAHETLKALESLGKN